jgi:hypothetical protein
LVTSCAAWRAVLLAVVVAVVAAPWGGCTESETCTLRLTVLVDATVPAFDFVQVSVSSMRGGDQFQSVDFRLKPTDFDANGSGVTTLRFPAQAEEVDALAEVHAGSLIVGHGRRSLVTLESLQSYDLEVEVAPNPPF